MKCFSVIFSSMAKSQNQITNNYTTCTPTTVVLMFFHRCSYISRMQKCARSHSRSYILINNFFYFIKLIIVQYACCSFSMIVRFESYIKNDQNKSVHSTTTDICPQMRSIKCSQMWNGVPNAYGSKFKPAKNDIFALVLSGENREEKLCHSR